MARTAAPKPRQNTPPPNPEATPPFERIIPLDPSQPITDEMRRQLRKRWPTSERLAVAFKLAKDRDACEALLLGQPVDPARIHQDELERALEPRLVQLVRPIDVLHGKAA